MYRTMFFLMLLVILDLPLDGQVQEAKTLRILNWSEYIDVEPASAEGDAKEPITKRSRTLREFAEKTGCRIEYEEFDAPDQAYSLITADDARYDIVVLSDDQIGPLSKAGFFLPLDHAKIPNLANLSPELRSSAFDSGNKYSVPYLAGSSGILFRRDLVEGVDSWKSILIDPAPELKGKIALLEDASIVVGAFLKSLGLSANSTDAKDLRRVQRSLKRLQDGGFLAEITSDVDHIVSSLLAGKFNVALTYSGDGLKAARAHPDKLSFRLPSEGSVWFVDNMLITTKAQNVDLAHAFIDHVLRGEVHARLAMSLHYQCPNAAAHAYLSEEYLKDPAIHPPRSIMEKMEPYHVNDVAGRTRILASVDDKD